MPSLKEILLILIGLLSFSSLQAQTIIQLTADPSNSSEPILDSSMEATLNDPFVYDPNDPFFSSPNLSFASNRSFHGGEANSGAITLTYLLSHSIDPDLPKFVVDLWGRDLNLVTASRDDDFDVEIFNGMTSLGRVAGLAIDSENHFARAEFGSLPEGTEIDRIVITARQSETGATSASLNRFTLQEIRAAALDEIDRSALERDVRQVKIINTTSTIRGIVLNNSPTPNINPGPEANKLVVAVNFEGRGAPRAVEEMTFAGLQLTHAFSDVRGGNLHSEFWYLDNPPASSNPVFITWDGNVNGCVVGVYSLSRAALGQPAVTLERNGTSISVTPPLPGSLFITSLVANDEAAAIAQPPLTGLVSGRTVSTNQQGDGGFLLVGTANGAVASATISAQETFSFTTNTGSFVSPSISTIGVISPPTLPLVVTTLEDKLDSPAGGRLSLREALRDALDDTTILFAPGLNGGTLQLDPALGPLLVEKSFRIDASNLPDGITIDGGSNGNFSLDQELETRCLVISNGNTSRKTTVALNNFTIQNGVLAGSAAGANIHNLENLTLTNCRILNGRGSGNNVRGGGIYSQDGNLTMVDCTVAGNQISGSNTDGGGIYNANGVLTLTDCTISGNAVLGSGSQGGGILSLEGECFFTRCTLTDNESVNSSGGGIFINKGDLTLEHCTVVENNATSGGGIFLLSDSRGTSHRAIFDSTVVRDSNGDDIVQQVTGGSFFTESRNGLNLVGTGTASVLNGFTATERNTNPLLLAELANYGGLTETMPPLPGSPAINSAIGSIATTDQRGIPTESIPDIGAAEFQGIEPTILVTSAADELDVISSDGTGVSLREAIRDSVNNQEIRFAPDLNGQTIQLADTLGQIMIDKALTIDASDLADGIIIDGRSNGDDTADAGETRCLLISNDDDAVVLPVFLNNLTIQNGVAVSKNPTDGSPVLGNGGNISNRENLTLTDCQILDGRAIGEFEGGGIESVSGTLTLQRCVISGNRARTGGGIKALSNDVIMSDCTVSGNQASGSNADGGGIFNENGVLTLTDSTISGNTVLGSGSQGAGIFSQGGECFFTRCTITDNESVSSSGGGIFINKGDLTLEHCTVVENNATNGGGIFLLSDSRGTSHLAIFDSTIVRDNNGDDIVRQVTGGSFSTESRNGLNLVGTGTAGVLNGFTATERNTDPLVLAELANYGGLTETMPPLPGSPAINSAFGSIATADQRSIPTEGIPDIGAAEFQGLEPILVTTAADELDVIASDGAGVSLREAIRDSVNGQEIRFAPDLNGQTIQLADTLGHIVIDKAITIDASDLADGIIIDGRSNGDDTADAGETRCLLISNDDDDVAFSVFLINLIIQNGVAVSKNPTDGSPVLGNGGNISNRENLTLTNCQILDGRATGSFDGGGIESFGGKLTLRGCLVSGNRAETGGGMKVESSDLMISDSTLSNNNASFSGGGIIMINGDLTMERNTLSNNSSQNDAGGIDFVRGTAQLSFCTLTGNTAVDKGGALFTNSSSTSSTNWNFTHCTIVGNASGEGRTGGGLFFQATRPGIIHTATLDSTIMRDNMGDDLVRNITGGTFGPEPIGGQNLVGTGNALEEFPSSERNSNVPLRLGALANNGGPTQTMLPQLDSPVIDAATDSDATVDQRGSPIERAPDIGAAERQGPALDPLSDDDGDGLALVLERALGTDPDIEDFGSSALPSISEASNEKVAFTFGRGANPLPNTVIIVERSTTLQAGSFEEVYRFDFDTETSTVAPDSEIVETLETDQFIITDEFQTDGKAFYRLSAILLPN